MNASSRLSQCDFPSDTFRLVDVCVERVRLAARLDDDAVLPPLPVVAKRRDVLILEKSAVIGSLAGDGRAPPATAGSAVRSRRDVPTARRASRRPRADSRGALVMCAVVALVAASAAFLASPLGRAPSVVHVTEAARGHGQALVEGAYGVVKLVSRP